MAPPKLTRVMIVEDNEFHRDLMRDVVTCNEMRVVEAEGDDWLEQTDEFGRPICDIVVVDLDLPDEKGIRLVEKIQALPDPKRPRVVGLHPAAGPDPRRRDGLPLEVQDLLSGPLDVGGFARCVKRQALDLRLADKS